MFSSFERKIVREGTDLLYRRKTHTANCKRVKYRFIMDDLVAGYLSVIEYYPLLRYNVHFIE